MDTFKILFEDNHILVLTKPVNILSQGDRTGDVSMIELVNDYLRIKYNKPGKAYVGLLHRLDRPVGGVMIFAKTSKAFERLQMQMKNRTIEKTYLAACESKPILHDQLLEHYLTKDSAINKVKISEFEVPGSKICQLHYKVLGSMHDIQYLQIRLITGRSHQIRAQLAYIGSPILGDVKYGQANPKTSDELGLYSYSIAIEHPILKKRMIWSALPEPKGYWSGLKAFFEISNSM